MARPHPDETRKRARELREQGLGYKHIAARLGVSAKTVYRWLNPEYAERQRAISRELKERYRGECMDCGAPTSGGDGPGKAPKRCTRCANKHNTFWTRETTIEAIREYHRRYGRQPTAIDWNVPMARRILAPERVAEVERRWEEGLWPYVSTVRTRFGTWNAAIEAAGFTPLPVGERLDPERWRANLRVRPARFP